MKKVLNFVKSKFLATKNWFVSLVLFKKILIVAGLGALIIAGVFFTPKLKTTKINYQTEKVAKGTLVISISGSGSISSGNSTNITTAATGTIKEVYVTNGDTVTKGQKIASITLDEYGQEQQAEAWSNYIDSLNDVKTAQAAKDGYDIKMWQAAQAITDAEDNIKNKDLSPINPDTGEAWTIAERTIIDKALEKAKLDYAAAEDKYKNADAAIAKAQAKVTAAYRDYQEVSSIIYAPIAGVVNNLSLSPGVIISSSTTSKTATSTSSSTSNTTNTITSQQIGKIYNTDGQLQASVNLSESDVVNVAPNQKVTLTLDAYSGKTFTGKVLAVDTSGSVSSGVTTYPVTILLDKTSVDIYPNMTVSATIITKVLSNAILVSSSAIETTDNNSLVYVLKNNQPTAVTVTTGETDGTKTEIKKGLSVGDAVITNYVSATDPSQSNTNSAFSSSFTRSSSSTKSSSSSKSSGGSMMMMGGGPGF